MNYWRDAAVKTLRDVLEETRSLRAMVLLKGLEAPKGVQALDPSTRELNSCNLLFATLGMGLGTQEEPPVSEQEETWKVILKRYKKDSLIG